MKRKLPFKILFVSPITWVFLCSGLFVNFSNTSQNIDYAYTEVPKTVEDSIKVRIIFAGDIMGHDPQIQAAFDAKTQNYDYHENYEFLKPYIEDADLAIANLEVTLAGKPYSGYPMFSSPDPLAQAVKDAGFDILQTANNHCCDKGKKGLERTLSVLDSLGIKHFGTYQDTLQREQNYPLITQVKGLKIALLNYTYGTNGMPSYHPNFVNSLDSTQIKTDLEKARNSHSDMIIVTVHWGAEYQRYENQVQRNWATLFARHGADLVIGAHPHVIQPFAEINSDNNRKTKVAYSLGNFISNQRDRFKNGGIITEINILKYNNKTTVTSMNYLPVFVRKQESPIVKYQLIPVALYEKNPSQFNLNFTEISALKIFAEDTRTLLKGEKESNYYSK